MKIEKIPESVQKKIDEYASLGLGGKAVCTPYFINDKRRKDLRAMVGKGTPEEIIMEARIWEKLKGVDFSQMSDSDIKQFLTGRGLGIDCSGFVIHTLDALYMEKHGKHIWHFLKIPRNDIWSKIRYLLRPVEQLGADIITDSDNTTPISINEVQPGDLIRSKAKKNNADHIMLVTEVTKDDSNNVTSIIYTHSSPYYGKLNGIKTGEIKITDLNKPLQDQDWLEKDEAGVNHTLEGFMVDVEDNGLRRLKTL